MKVEGKERKKMPIRRRETESEYFQQMRVLRWKLETARKGKEDDRRKESTVKAAQTEAC